MEGGWRPGFSHAFKPTPFSFDPPPVVSCREVGDLGFPTLFSRCRFVFRFPPPSAFHGGRLVIWVFPRFLADAVFFYLRPLGVSWREVGDLCFPKLFSRRHFFFDPPSFGVSCREVGDLGFPKSFLADTVFFDPPSRRFVDGGWRLGFSRAF